MVDAAGPGGRESAIMSGFGRALVIAGLLSAPASALAADPIASFHVAPTGFATTKKTLKRGVVYTMEISGTRREDFQGSVGTHGIPTMDAFYCFFNRPQDTH